MNVKKWLGACLLALCCGAAQGGEVSAKYMKVVFPEVEETIGEEAASAMDKVTFQVHLYDTLGACKHLSKEEGAVILEVTYSEQDAATGLEHPGRISMQVTQWGRYADVAREAGGEGRRKPFKAEKLFQVEVEAEGELKEILDFAIGDDTSDLAEGERIQEDLYLRALMALYLKVSALK